MCVDVRPGQLWRFTDSLDWIVTRVTAEGRQVSGLPTSSVMKRGSTFMVVSLDDSGPGFRLPPYTTDLNGLPSGNQPEQRWHVVILDDRLTWFRHDWFEQSTLLSDAEP